MTSESSLPRISNLISSSFLVYKNRFGEFVPIIGFYILVGIVNILFALFLTHILKPQTTILEISKSIMNLIAIYLQTYLAAVLTIRIAHKDGQKDNAFFLGWEKSLAFFVLSLIALSSIMFGAFLFIIPGLIIGTFICVSDYVLLLENKNITTSIYKSREYVRSYGWQVFYRFVFVFSPYFFWYILLGVLFPNPFIEITELLTAIFFALYLPFLTIFGYKIYLSLKEIKGEAKETASGKFKFFFWSIASIGTLIIVISYLYSLLSSTGIIPAS